MRETWTDERMDDLSRHMDRRFDAVDHRFDAVDHRLDAVDRRLDGIDKRLDRMDDRFERLNASVNSKFEQMTVRIDLLQHTMLRLGGGMIATLAIGFAGLIATRL